MCVLCARNKGTLLAFMDNMINGTSCSGRFVHDTDVCLKIVKL